MKLVSCYIENFGVISRRSIQFDENLSVVFNANGTGKSTLACFIKAMFYGLPSSRVNAKAFEDRQHYYPFNGGKFGGNLTFEKDGVVYRIERFFDKKSDTRDSLTVYRGAAATGELGADIGRTVFGLDENSFMRTVFLTAAETDGGTTSDINARLNSYVLSAEGEGGFDRAVSLLEERRKGLKAGRGSGGLIDRTRAERQQLKEDIAQLEAVEKGLAARYEDRKTLCGQIAALEKSQKQVNEDRLLGEKWANYDRYTAEIAEKRGALDGIAARYPQGLPAAEELKRAESGCLLLSKNQSVLENIAPSEDKRRRLEALSAVFGGGYPDGRELQAAEDAAERVAVLTAEIEREENAPSDSRFTRLADVFRAGLPQEDGLESVRAAAERYKADVAQLKDAAVPAAGGAKKNIFFVVLAVAAVLLAVAGAVIMASVGFGAGMGVLIAAVLLLACDGAAYAVFLKRRKAVSSAAADGIRTRLRQDEQTLRAFLAQYGYYSESVISDFTAFLSDMEAYKVFLADGAARRGALEKKTAARNVSESAVRALLLKYGYTRDTLRGGIAALREDVASYLSLADEMSAAEGRRAALLAENKGIEAGICRILGAYGIPFTGDKAQLDVLLEERRRQDTLAADEEALIKKAEQYKRDNALTVRARTRVSREEAEAAAACLADKRRELGLLDRQISEDEADLERLPDKRSKLESTEESLTKLQESYDLLTDTLALLKKADQRLKDKYVAPVKDRFLYYAEKTERALGDRMVMDENFCVSFERGGEIRTEKHLSAGQRAVCNLCLRLSLMDNMYKGEKPFVIMDDPFAALDAENMAAAARVVRELSSDRQIIYFCCHESRRI